MVFSVCWSNLILGSLSKTTKAQNRTGFVPLFILCSETMLLHECFKPSLREGLGDEKNFFSSGLIVLLDQQYITLAVYRPL